MTFPRNTHQNRKMPLSKCPEFFYYGQIMSYGLAKSNSRVKNVLLVFNTVTPTNSHLFFKKSIYLLDYIFIFYFTRLHSSRLAFDVIKHYRNFFIGNNFG